MRLNSTLSFIIYLVIVLLNFPIFGQPVYYKQYTASQGLPSSTVYRTMMDSKGYIWASTSAGLARFDSHEFMNFDPANKMPDYEIFDIAEDKKGRTWFTTLRGITGYIENNTCYEYTSIPELNKYKIVQFYFDPNGDIWFFTDTEKIFHTRNNKIIQSYNTDIPNRACGMTQDNRGFYWICNQDNNYIWQVTPHGLKKIILSNNSYTHAFVRKPYLLKDGRIAITGNEELYLFNTEKQQTVTFNGNGILKDQVLISVMEDDYNVLWVSTLNGIYLFEPSGTSYTFRKKILNNIKTSTVVQDFEGNYWVATLGEGLIYFPYHPLYTYSIQQVAGGNHFFVIDQTSDGKVLTATDKGEIFSLQAEKLQLIKNTYSSVLGRNRILKTLHHSNGSLWLGGDNGISIYDKGRIKHINDYLYIKCLAETPDGKVWGGTNTGLVQFQPDGKKILSANVGRVTAIATNEAGTVLYGNDQGLFSYNHPVSKKIMDGKKIKNTWINSIGIDKKRRIIWLSTGGDGLIGIKGNTIKYHFTDQQKLMTNILGKIVIENDGSLWISSSKGIHQMKWVNDSLVVNNRIQSNAGLISNEVYDFTMNDTALWVATSGGISVLDKRFIYSTQIPPPVYIKKVSIQGDIISNHQKITTYNDASNIVVDIVGISYSSNPEVYYMYQLLGSDTSWAISKSGSIHFSGLDAGNYTLNVKAVNSEGIESKIPAKLSIEIKNIFIRSTFFKILIALAILVIVFSIIYLRIYQLRQQEKQRLSFEKALGETKLAALKAQMNPHFVFNSLGSIQNLINQDRKHDANVYLSKFARLLRYTLELSDNKSISLADEINLLELYLSLESLRFIHKFEYEIKTAPGLNLYSILIPPLLIQPFVENAIKHGLIFQKKKAKLKIKFENHGKSAIYCMIEDNGIGREAREKMKKKSGIDTHISRGMDNTQNRLMLINQTIDEPTSLKVTDLYDEGGNALGTRVELIIPIG
jgi:ligand-binding sensor domain-containing protein